jgi:DtxR family transcriptional regulator, Mn-dependent transcriptional regulator
MQSQSEENYLKAIYLLDIQGNKATPTSLAKSLGNNPASVVDMLKKLTRKKLATYSKTAGAVLTNSGMRLALRMVRRHRLWEMFLHEKLEYGWDEVHDIAEQLEHVQGNNLADRLDKFLGFPRFDPHGEAIPGANGKIEKISSKTLFDIETGNSCKVVSIKDTSKLFLQYLDKLNIEIGAGIKIIDKITFDGSLMILVNKTRAMVSREFAKSIYVN